MTSAIAESLTLTQAARMIREAVRDKTYQDLTDLQRANEKMADRLDLLVAQGMWLESVAARLAAADKLAEAVESYHNEAIPIAEVDLRPTLAAAIEALAAYRATTQERTEADR